MRHIPVLLASLACSLFSAQATVIVHDYFNGSSSTNNNGSGAVNPTGTTTIFTAATAPGQNANGAYFSPVSGNYTSNNLASITGNNGTNTAFVLSATATSFQFTLTNVVVTANSTNRPGIPNDGVAGFRYEIGVVSANDTNPNPELYADHYGGIYVNLFYDMQGNLTGDLRMTNKTKSASTDNSGSTGIFELASFNLASGFSPVTLTVNLTNNNYAVSFSQSVTMISGSLSGSFAASANFTTEFDNGVRVNMEGQNWNNGRGSGNVSELLVSTVPEPSTVGFLCFAGFGALILRHRIRSSQS